ncbi:MAG: TraX family protein [Lachnospiraceae bacterium]|nr:TraX family protein [Lachnospiraceae bacterium]
MLKRLNGNQLKLIAVVSMMLDHIGYIIIGSGIVPELYEAGKPYAFWWVLYMVFRALGRVAFPVYAFLLVEGFMHTRDWRRYALRLGIFALISEIPFDLAITNEMMDLRIQNVFFTLLLGLFMLRILEEVRHRAAGTGGQLLQFLVIGVFCGIAWWMHTDYDYIGIMMIALCYWFYQGREQLCMMGFLWMALMLRQLYYVPGYVLAFLLIYLYNGKRGTAKGKYAFYLFYPAHLLVLYGIFRICF